MMTRQERAKQFIPFDAMKGLQEALRSKEEKKSRVEKHEICEEQQEKISEVLVKADKGMVVWLSYYKAFHDVEKKGTLTAINKAYKYLLVDDEKIFFNDIYDIEIVDIEE
jgi:hypothetical protein